MVNRILSKLGGETIGDGDKISAEISRMPTDQLRSELVRGLTIVAEDLLRLAMIVKELESRGEDLSALRIGLLHHLRKIACGQLLPEVVVHFAARPSLIELIGSLPTHPYQKQLADGEPVKLLTYTGNGELDHRMADPLAMTREQIVQVFARDHIRDDAEQVMILDQRRQKSRRRGPDKIGIMGIDRERGGVVVGRKFIPLADLAEAVRVLRG